MAKFIFPFQIKYKEHYIPSNTAFEADDSDKKELLKMGGKIINDNKNASKAFKIFLARFQTGLAMFLKKPMKP